MRIAGEPDSYGTLMSMPLGGGVQESRPLAASIAA